MNIIKNIEACLPDEPQPLTRPIAEASEFPVNALGPVLSAGVKAVIAMTQAPEAMCAQSVLAAAALVAQAHVDVELPTGVKPSSLFFLTIACSGERKTTVDNIVLAAINAKEKQLTKDYKNQFRNFLNKQSIWEKDRTEKLKNDPQALDSMEMEPEPPALPMIVCDEPNRQGLERALREGQPSLGIFSAEGGSFIGGHGMASENRMNTASSLSLLWDGEASKKVRGGELREPLFGRRVSTHLMAQPEVANKFVGDAMLQDQGLLARFLIIRPPSNIGKRPWVEISEKTKQDLQSLNDCFTDILKLEFPLEPETTKQLDPKPLKFSEKARENWINFINSVEKRLSANQDFEPIIAFAGKAGEHAGRLAAVLAFTRDKDVQEISEDVFADAEKIMLYYLNEAIRINGLGGVDRKIESAQKALDWLQSDSWSESFVSLPDLYQNGPPCIRNRKSAAEIAKVLMDHNWLLPVNSPMTVNGKKRQKVWKIVEAPTSHTPELEHSDVGEAANPAKPAKA